MDPPVIKLHGSRVNRKNISNYTFSIIIVNEATVVHFDESASNYTKMRLFYRFSIFFLFFWSNNVYFVLVTHIKLNI